MGFKIPQSQYRAFEILLKFSSEELERLAAVLRKTPPALYTSQFAKAVAKKTDIKINDARQIIAMLASMYATRSNQDVSDEKFLKDVREALEDAEKPGIDPAKTDWESFERFFSEVLKFEDTLGVTSKAAEILLGNEKNYVEARIFTDIRPVFCKDPNKPPAATVIIHNLKITYSEDDETKEIFLALDLNDLRSLKATIERAILKEEGLTPLLEEKSLNLLK